MRLGQKVAIGIVATGVCVSAAWITAGLVAADSPTLSYHAIAPELAADSAAPRTATASPTASASSTAAATSSPTTTSSPTASPTGNACSDATGTITALDKAGETVTVNATGDLTGWVLVSTDGNQEFHFPGGFVASGTLTIVSDSPQFTDTSSRLWWTTTNIWNNSQEDDAKLLNCQGQQVSFLAGP